MDERKRDVEYRVSPNISSVTGSGGQSRGVKKGSGQKRKVRVYAPEWKEKGEIPGQFGGATDLTNVL